MSATAELGLAENAYHAERVSATTLGLDIDTDVNVQRLIEGSEARSLQTANFRFRQFGAVAISRELVLPDLNQTVGQTVDDFIASVVANSRANIDDPNVIGSKDFVSPEYGTTRRMRTVAYDKVTTHFPQAIDFQHRILPMVRHINGDPETIVSVDPDEGTVINYQLFHLDGDPDAFQQHGAHNDRVDFTVVACVDNVGPNGELVFVEGYDAACANLRLDPFHDFNETMREILTRLPNGLTFRAHAVNKGDLLMIQSAENIHFITPKTLANVQAGVDQGHTPIDLLSAQEPGLVVGRAIANCAFESVACQQDDRVSRMLEWLYTQETGHPFDTKSAAFYEEIDRLAAKSTLDQLPNWRNRTRSKVINAVINRSTAHKLYLEPAV